MSILVQLLQTNPKPLTLQEEDQHWCNICEEPYPKSEFYKRKSGSLYGHCKTCQKAMVNNAKGKQNELL